MAIINSLLDNDLDKFTMLQAILHRYPAVTASYRLVRKGNPVKIRENEFRYEIDSLCKLRFQEDELEYLSRFPFFSSDFIDFLRIFQFNPKYIRFRMDPGNGLECDIHGPWLSTILFETPVLAIISEIVSRYNSLDGSGQHSIAGTLKQGDEILDEKINRLALQLKTGQVSNFRFAEFGTRNRYSLEWQKKVIEALKTGFRPAIFEGTSNVFFARKFNIKPIGTMGHEWIQAHQQINSRLDNSQTAALDAWINEYRGRLGIALSDTINRDAFLRDFDLYFAKLFDGCRHNSGDPETWCVKLIEHYDKFGIDPKTKTAVFSSGMDFNKAIDLSQMFNEMIGVSFHMGRYLTHDMGIEQANVRLPMTACNQRPVARISDDPEKTFCEDPEYLNMLKKTFAIEEAQEADIPAA